ncbi:UDP-N-acetylglucosamine 2-epimerase [candidate division MSBL1 archaeon SCGC-AAA385M11]|nr:UDP-N-acetylglucosamine 2-epimerase [candidate division MSBL1 archaeon SCGC-AAA385M11]
MKILVIIGTRPEGIKLAPVILALKANKRVKTIACATGQHKEILDQVFEIFNIKPDINLSIMQAEQTLAQLTAQVVTKVDAVLKELLPDLVLIQGDTTTVMASAMACFYNNIPVGHVEAGLRSGNLWSPFPEEMNRSVAGILASLHFAPTERARQALLRANVDQEKIFLTGNTVIDALQYITAAKRPAGAERILDKLEGKRFILVTAHRRENFGQRFEEICTGLKEIVQRNPDVAIVYPVHLNPNVQEPVSRILKGIERVLLIDPVEYNVLAHLLSSCTLVLTDSGGIQEEAPSLGKPVLVMRTETERPEGIEAGTARLVGPCKEAILRETEKILHNEDEYLIMARAVNPYGDGQAAQRIVKAIEKYI